ALVAREDVGPDVAERVADVEPCAARVREHVEREELLAVGDLVEALAEQTAGIRSPEGVLLLPTVLTLRFDLVREARVVPEASCIVDVGHQCRGYACPRAPPRLLSHRPRTVERMCCVSDAYDDRSRAAGTLVSPSGGVAQLVERLHGMQEVRGFESH